MLYSSSIWRSLSCFDIEAIIFFRMVSPLRQNTRIIAHDFVMTQNSIPLARILASGLAEVIGDSMTPDRVTFVQKKAPPDLLEQFCRIAEARDTAVAVVAFARRWGLLGLCEEHGLPYRHTHIVESVNDDGSASFQMMFCSSGDESVQHWKELAVCFDSLLRLGLDLNRGSLGSDLDWQLAAIEDFLQGMPPPSNIADARSMYKGLIWRMIEMSQLQPHFEWNNGAWTIDLDSISSSNLPAILTLQLMLRVANAKVQIKCSTCPRWFIPRRNQRKYCDKCGRQAMWRVGQQKRRGTSLKGK
jgi:predicted RNA-binding Zn-ribbon protein involved in translation (DUF1610 family)